MFFKRTFFHKEYIQAVGFVLFFALLVGFAFIVYANVFVLSRFSHLDQSQVATSSVAIVFGGGVLNGAMTPLQEQRIVTAVRLYQEGRVERLLLSGDNGRNRFDEVSLMYQYAIDAGVSAQDILLDWHGYRTYESCYRAKHVFGVNDAVVISQMFHLPRISYLCQSLGVDVSPVPADMVPNSSWWGPKWREVFARAKAVWQGEITHPTPDFLVP